MGNFDARYQQFSVEQFKADFEKAKKYAPQDDPNAGRKPTRQWTPAPPIGAPEPQPAPNEGAPESAPPEEIPTGFRPGSPDGETASSQWAGPGDYAKGVLNGVLDAGREILQFVSPSEKLDELLDVAFPTPPKEEDSLGPSLVRNATQYAISAVPLGAALATLGVPAMAAYLGSGAVTAAAVFDPREHTLGNTLQAVLPEQAGKVLGITAVNPDDPDWLARSKRAAEDVALNLTGMGLFRLAKRVLRSQAAIVNGKALTPDSIEGVARGLEYDEVINRVAGDEIIDRVRAVQATRDTLDDIDWAKEVLASGDVDTAIDSITASNQALGQRVRALVDDPNALAAAEARALQESTAAENAYVTLVEQLEPTTATRVTSVVDRYVPESMRSVAEATSLRLKPHLEKAVGRTGAGIAAATKRKGFVKSKFFPGTLARKGAEAAAQTILAKPRHTVADRIALAFHLEPDEWWRIGSVDDALTTLATKLNLKRYGRILGVRKDEDVFEVTAKEFGSNGLRARLTLDKVMPGIKNPEQKILALRVAEESTVHRIHALGRKPDYTIHDLAQFLRLNRLGQNLREVLSGRGNTVDKGVDAFASIKPVAADGKVGKHAAKMAALRSDEELVAGAGGVEEVTKLLRAWGNGIANMTPEARFNLGRAVVPTSGMRLAANAFYEMFVNGLLGRPYLWARNVINNTYFGLWAPIEDHALGIAAGREGAWAEMIDSYRFMLDGMEAALHVTGTFKNASASLRAIGNLDFSGFWQSAKATGESIKSSNVGRAVKESRLVTGPEDARQYQVQDAGRSINEFGHFLADKMKMRSSFAHRIVDATATTLNIPNKALIAGDELAKSINWYSHAGRNARALARSRGLQGAAADQFVNDLRTAAKVWHVLEPDEIAKYSKLFGTTEDELPRFLKEFDLKATEYARKLTFSDTLVDGTASSWFQTVTRSTPGLRWMAPFIRVPAKILQRAAERTPLVFLPKTASGQAYRQALAEGGLAAEAAKSRVLVGTTLMTLFGMQALSGRITGRGPLNPQENKVRRQLTGAEFDSIRIDRPDGPIWVPLDLASPHGKIASSIATLTEVFANQDEGENLELASNIVQALSDVLLDQGPYEQFLDVWSFIREPSSAELGKIGGKYLTGLMPYHGMAEFGADLVREEGEEVKQQVVLPDYAPALEKFAEWLYQTVNDAYTFRVEGREQVNILGEPITRHNAYTKMPDDDLSREVARLSEIGRGIRINTEDAYSYFGSGQAAVRLTPEQRSFLIKAATGGHYTGGVTMREMLNREINGPDYQSLSDGGGALPNGPTRAGKAEYLETLIRARIKQSWGPLLIKYPEIGDAFARRAEALGISAAQGSNATIEQLLSP